MSEIDEFFFILVCLVAMCPSRAWRAIKVVGELWSVLRCAFGSHEWTEWLPATEEWKERRFCQRCPKIQIKGD